MSGSDSKIKSCYAQIRSEDHRLYSHELVKRLDSDSVSQRSTALTGLFTIRDEAIAAHLMKMSNDSSATVRQLAVFYLGELRAKYAVATISERLSDKSQEVRAAARIAYRKITGADA